MKIGVRKAKLADFDDILKLNQALFDYEEQFNHEYNLNWPYEKAGRSYFKKRFKNKKSLIFVAEDKSKVIGYILAFIDIYSYRRINPICEIENMFIEKEYRRKKLVKNSWKRLGVLLKEGE
jgi:ribosomal protein S18 acetylase RimI-like enzyme